MLRSYLVNAYRNLTGRKIPSLVNIFSLSISAVASLFLGEQIVHQLHFDDFHEKGDRIYRVVGGIRRDLGVYPEARTGAPLAELLESEFPEVERAVRFSSWYGNVRAGDKVFEGSFRFADEDFFEVFSFEFVKGNPETALKSPFSVVLSERAARRYFGDEEPMGQIISYTSSVDHQPHEFTITGIMKDVPNNSHLKIEQIGSLSSLRNLQGWGDRFFEQKWYWVQSWTYVLTSKPLASTKAMDRRLTELVTSLGERTKQWKSMRFEPLEDIYLYSAAGGSGGGGGGRWIVPSQIFLVCFVLLIACVNFTSMSTANASERVREIGLRKALGCGRRQMMGQLLTEAFLQSAIAVFMVVALVEASKELLGGGGAGFNPDLWVTALVIVGVTGTAAGLYPALFFSAIQSPQALTGRMKFGSVGRLKRVFTVLQFTGSTIALIATFVIYEQLEAYRTADLGFNTTNLISIPTQYRDQRTIDAFTNTLLTDSRVLNVTAASIQPGLDNSPMHLTAYDPDTGRDIYFNAFYVDQGFLETMQIDMHEGDYARVSDLPAGTLLINQPAKKKLGMDPATGQELELFTGKGENRVRTQSGTIAGVTEGFHFRMVLSQTERLPAAMIVNPDRCRYLVVRVRTDDFSGLIGDMETNWSNLFGGHEMTHTRIDWAIDEAYTKMEYGISLVGGGVITPILLIACIGLFGITAVSLGGMKKDIAIRKSMGASVYDISSLISKEYVRLIGVSCLIAGPIVYFTVRIVGQKVVLQHVPQNPLAYLGGFFIIFACALGTVNSLAIHAGRANPVDALRSE
jgi:putative ABC transport system permease protein